MTTDWRSVIADMAVARIDLIDPPVSIPRLILPPVASPGSYQILGGGFVENTLTLRLPREEAVACGWVTPTPEEAAELEARRAANAAERAATQEGLAAAALALDAIDDPTWRKVLDLHQRTHYYDTCTTFYCDGCDQGCSCDSASWPCSTVRLAAEQNGIPMPGHEWDSLNRPTDGSLDPKETP